jgi:hypothetical protein
VGSLIIWVIASRRLRPTLSASAKASISRPERAYNM